MSYLSIPDNYFPLSSHSYFQQDGALRHQYVCLFHMVEAGRIPAFCLEHAQSYGFSYVLSGNAQLCFHDGSERQLSAGTFFQLDPEITRALYVDNDSDWRECSISIYQESFQRLCDAHALRKHNDVYSIGIQQKIIQAYLHCHTLMQQHDNLETHHVVHAILQCIGLIYAEIDQLLNKDDFLSQAKQLLIQEMTTRKSLEAIADELEMNYHAFRRSFKQKTGISPGDWQIQQRIRRAQLLLDTESIETVAEELGYADRFVFSRQFKKVSGLSPNEHRKLVNQPG